MRKTVFSLRFFNLLLIIGLALPDPVLALRGIESTESGLEEELAKALQPSTLASTTGAEEGNAVRTAKRTFEARLIDFHFFEETVQADALAGAMSRSIVDLFAMMQEAGLGHNPISASIVLVDGPERASAFIEFPQRMLISKSADSSVRQLISSFVLSEMGATGEIAPQWTVSRFLPAGSKWTEADAPERVVTGIEIRPKRSIVVTPVSLPQGEMPDSLSQAGWIAPEDITTAGLEEKGLSGRQFGIQLARRQAIQAWQGIAVTPPTSNVTKRLLPIFYSAGTFHAIPLIAKAGSPFLVITQSQRGEKGVRALLDGLRIDRGQYVIWRLDREKLDLESALGKARRDFAGYDTYPVDPRRSSWLQDLLVRLQKEGILLVGDITSALQATERYFQTLA